MFRRDYPVLGFWLDPTCLGWTTEAPRSRAVALWPADWRRVATLYQHQAPWTSTKCPCFSDELFFFFSISLLVLRQLLCLFTRSVQVRRRRTTRRRVLSAPGCAVAREGDERGMYAAGNGWCFSRSLFHEMTKSMKEHRAGHHQFVF